MDPSDRQDTPVAGGESTPFDPTIVTGADTGLPERYEVLSILGTGGMGKVLHARDKVLDREVAVKLLGGQSVADPTYAQRFLTEARAAASLNDPLIVQIYEFGENDGTTYLVMEYVDGRSLRMEMKDKGRFSERRTLALAVEAGRALAVAHTAGIVHRDVKPDNLMLTRAGAFKLVDLGLAKCLADDSGQTLTGQSMGTPHYISPEQILGAKVIDHRADIYSLGATMFFLATGHTPYTGSSGAHIMSRHLNDPLPDPRQLVPGLSAGFCRTVARAMAKDPRDRHLDMADLLGELTKLLAVAPPETDHPDSSGHLTAVGRTPSGRAVCPLPAPAFAPEELADLERALAAAIGPVARVLVRQESHRAASHAALVDALAVHVTEDTTRARFLRQCRGTDTAGSHGPGAGGSRSGQAESSALPRQPLDEAQLGRLSALLADRIGPVARVLVKREARAAAHLADLAGRLAEHIPDPAARSSFLAAAGQLG